MDYGYGRTAKKLRTICIYIDVKVRTELKRAMKEPIWVVSHCLCNLVWKKPLEATNNPHFRRRDTINPRAYHAWTTAVNDAHLFMFVPWPMCRFSCAFLAISKQAVDGHSMFQMFPSMLCPKEWHRLTQDHTGVHFLAKKANLVILLRLAFVLVWLIWLISYL